MDAAPLWQVSPENVPLGWGFIFEDVGFQPSSENSSAFWVQPGITGGS